MGIDEIGERLGHARYARGAYMQQLLAARILNAAEVLDDDGLAKLACFEEDDAKERTQAYLLQIKGVGREVIRGFEALRGG